MKKIIISILCLTAVFGAAGCGKKSASGPDIPYYSSLENYKFDPAIPLADRIVIVPPDMLKSAAETDGRADYKAYDPTAADKELFSKYLALLPPVYGRVFRERCVGVYFIENFMGNGVTSWVVDGKGVIYFYMILNPASLKNNLSKTLTDRERSCFIARPGLDIKVNAGQKYKGLLYALFHEGTHAVDYIKGVTPFADDSMPSGYFPASPLAGDFFRTVWADYRVPLIPGLIDGRENITFYGLGGGPKLEMYGVPAMYRELTFSPFISLYGSKSWAEDLAELASFAFITQKLGQPYSIGLTGFGPGPEVFYPMKGPAGPRSQTIMKLLESM
ncbi:MAG: hypothetical protein NTX59_05455 [Elusimicrobia bacterium]|nr:hypothetical protein [Elusimicrobiota bacterium]